MSENDNKTIKGLEQAVAHAKGDDVGARVTHVAYDLAAYDLRDNGHLREALKPFAELLARCDPEGVDCVRRGGTSSELLPVNVADILRARAALAGESDLIIELQKAQIGQPSAMRDLLRRTIRALARARGDGHD